METIKEKSIIKVFAMIFAVVGAFAFNSRSVEASSEVTGYIDAPYPCQMPILCSDIGESVCRDISGVQAFGKFYPTDTTCPIQVFARPFQ